MFVIFTEAKINRLHNFGKVHASLSHSLTAMISVYYYFKEFYQPRPCTDTGFCVENAEAEMLSGLGILIYLSSLVVIIISVVNYKIYLKKSWEYQSVLIGIYLTKPAMLVAVQAGPLLYACLLAQIYAFSNIINHRNETKPGTSFPLHCLLVYFTMNQYFYRGSHRARIDSIKFGKVCPGGLFCGEIFHWCLIFYELLAPFLICMFLLPIVVKARVKNVYASTFVPESE